MFFFALSLSSSFLSGTPDLESERRRNRVFSWWGCENLGQELRYCWSHTNSVKFGGWEPEYGGIAGGALSQDLPPPGSPVPCLCSPRKWRTLTSDDELWHKLFKERWGADAAAFYAPEGSKSWKDVFVVQDRCDRCGLGVRIIREGNDYYLIYQGEIQRFLGSRQNTSCDAKEAPQQSAADEQLQISERILFFLGDLEAACADAKRAKA